MTITVTNIVSGTCGHLTFSLLIDGVAHIHVFHRGDIWEALRDARSGAADEWDVFALFLRSHIKKYKEANPSATLAQIRTDVIDNFKVVL